MDLDGATVVGTGSPPSSDTSFNPNGLSAGRTYAVVGQKLVAISNANGASVFNVNPAGVTLGNNFPIPVVLSTHCTADPCSPGSFTTIFLGGDDGFLYKYVFDPANPSNPTKSARDLRRLGCPNDKLMSTPAIQLYRGSNTAFQNAMRYQGSTCQGGSNPGTPCPNGNGCLGGGTCAIGSYDNNDLVVVATYYVDGGPGCEGGKNRVYALNSSDLSTKWVYNEEGTAATDGLEPSAEACTIEYSSGSMDPDGVNNLVVCTFDQNLQKSSNVVMAFSTATSLATGSPRWGYGGGSAGVQIRPAIATINGVRRIYVADVDGYLNALIPTTGAPAWSSKVHVDGGVRQNFFAEFRSFGAGALRGRLFVLTTSGQFRRLIDRGTSAIEEGAPLVADPSFGVKFVSAASTSFDGIWLGQDDGRVRQLSTSYQLQEAQIVGGPKSKVVGITIEIDPATMQASQLIATATGDAINGVPNRVVKLSKPFCINPAGGADPVCSTNRQCQGSSVDPSYDPCNARRCDAISGSCGPPQGLLDNTPCDDSSTCSMAYPDAAGCPASKCVDGPNHGMACSSNADCTGGAPNHDCVLVTGRASMCNGGAEDGNFCPAKCTGGNNGQCSRSTDSNIVCGLGGVCGNVPNSTACPPKGRCVKWSPAGDGSCAAVGDNPFCNTVADCPTTKYCAGDPTHRQGASNVSCAGGAGVDSCCAGGVSFGPCLVWSACINNVCVRTVQKTCVGGTNPGTLCTDGGPQCLGGGTCTGAPPTVTSILCGAPPSTPGVPVAIFKYGDMACPGGAIGIGGVGPLCASDSDCPGKAPGSCDALAHRCQSSCNNVCIDKKCRTNSYASCPCESDGDRACETTCCGFQGTCRRLGEICSADGDCCSGLCVPGAPSRCGGAALTCKRSASACAGNLECCSQVCSGGLCAPVLPGVNCKNTSNDSKNCGGCGNDCGVLVCQDGQCVQPAASSCGAPTDTAIQLAGASGANHLTFEKTSDHKCSAWMSSASPTNSQLIRVSDTTTSTFDDDPNQATYAIGVATMCQGQEGLICSSSSSQQTLASYTTLTTAPIGVWSSGGAFFTGEAAGTAPSAGLPASGPFVASQLNQGLVGPAALAKDYSGTSASRKALWANWNANGDVKEVSGAGNAVTAPCVACRCTGCASDCTDADVGPYLTSVASRVTAIAAGTRTYRWVAAACASLNVHPPTRDLDANYVYLGHGTAFTAVNIEPPPTVNGLRYMANPSFPRRVDIDLATACPAPACGPQSITGIESIAPHHKRSVVYVVARGSTLRFVIAVDVEHGTARTGIEDQDALAVSNPGVCGVPADENSPMTCAACSAQGYLCMPDPAGDPFAASDAKIAIGPYGNLYRMVLPSVFGGAIQDVAHFTVTRK